MDVWTAAGESADQMFDVEIILASFSADLFDNRFSVEQELDPRNQDDPNYEVIGMLTSVPEPSTGVLVLLAIGTGLLRRTPRTIRRLGT